MSGRKGITQTSAVKDTNYNYIFIIFKTNSRTAAENSAVVFCYKIKITFHGRWIVIKNKERERKSEKENFFICAGIDGVLKRYTNRC